MNVLRNIKKALFAAALVGFAGGTHAQSIVGSKHDLTSAASQGGGTSVTTQVCVFCHTPHGAARSSLRGAAANARMVDVCHLSCALGVVGRYFSNPGKNAFVE